MRRARRAVGRRQELDPARCSTATTRVDAGRDPGRATAASWSTSPPPRRAQCSRLRRDDASAMSASSCASCRASPRSTSSPSRCVARGVDRGRGARRAPRRCSPGSTCRERLWALPPATFSGGEQQRVNIARGFIADAPGPAARRADRLARRRQPRRRGRADPRAQARRGAALLGIFHDEDVREQRRRPHRRRHPLSPPEVPACDPTTLVFEQRPARPRRSASSDGWVAVAGRAHRRGRRGTGARARHRPRRRPCWRRAWSSCTPTTWRATSRRARRCAWPTTGGGAGLRRADRRRPASRRCSTRCALGDDADRGSQRRRRSKASWRRSTTARSPGPAARRPSPAPALRDLRRRRGRGRRSACSTGMPIDLMSLMDHTPGPAPVPRPREAWRPYYGGKSGLHRGRARRLHASGSGPQFASATTRATVRALVALAQAAVGRRWRATTTPHPSMCEESIADGVSIAEFPTTLEAAAPRTRPASPC